MQQVGWIVFAFHILKFRKDIQLKTICLSTSNISTIHVVTKGKNQAQNIGNLLACVEHLLSDTKSVLYFGKIYYFILI